MLQALLLVPGWLEVATIYTDATYVVNNFNEDMSHCVALFSHANAWAAVWDRVDELAVEGTEVRVLKRKVHNETLHVDTIFLTFGHTVADRLAVAGAAFESSRVRNVALEVEALDDKAVVVIDGLTKIGLQFASTSRPSLRRTPRCRGPLSRQMT